MIWFEILIKNDTVGGYKFFVFYVVKLFNVNVCFAIIWVRIFYYQMGVDSYVSCLGKF